MKLYKDACSAWISPASAETFSHRLTSKCLKNAIDLLLFSGEHFYGFSESAEILSMKDDDEKAIKMDLLLIIYDGQEQPPGVFCKKSCS